MLKEKLQIYLITYNRKKQLENTFSQIFAENSPIRDFDITILDNASTDGSSELIQEYAKQHSNINYIRHPYNIGGNANICRAFELSASCGKEYAWILCDDDYYDFSAWSEVEENIEKKKDIICLSDYVFPTEKEKENPAYQIFQLTFVPSILFRTSSITDSVLHNMYDNIYTMFQQLCLVIKVFNNGGSIQVLSKPIVHNVLFVNSLNYDISRIRGAYEKAVTERRRETVWALGYASVLTLLNNKDLISECMEEAYPSKYVCKSWNNFYRIIINKYFKFGFFNYFYEIFKNLKPKRKFEVILFIFKNFVTISIRVIKIKY